MWQAERCAEWITIESFIGSPRGYFRGNGRLLFKCFRCETRLGRLSNELQDATFEDPYHISFESTILFQDLPANFET